jgi:radical SAM-linked protein
MAGIDLFDYASRNLDPDGKLPWDFIDTGIKKESLRLEYQKALKVEITEDCRRLCYGCGLGCKEKEVYRYKETGIEKIDKIAHITTKQGLKKTPRYGIKLRVKYSKKGALRYLSHQELMTAILRAARRANIPLLYTSGFHPHPKVSFGPALPAGVEGMNEYLDVEIYPVMGPDEFKWRLNSELPQGIEVMDVLRINRYIRSLNEMISCYEYEITIDRDAATAINNFMSQPSCVVLRDGKAIDVRAMVKRAELHNGILRLTLIDTDNTKVRLFEVLQRLFSRPLEEIQQMQIKRTDIYSYNKDKVQERKKAWQVK